MNTITVGLIKGRHEMPVTEYIFDNGIENVHDYVAMRSHIKDFLIQAVGLTQTKSVPINGYVNLQDIDDGYTTESDYQSEVWTGKQKLVVYVTGLTSVTAELIRTCALNGVKLTLMHYDNATGEYVPQYIF